MNKFTLTFNSNQLEDKYQASRVQMRNNIFLGMIIIVLINNLLKLIIDALGSITSSWYLQLIVVIASLFGLVFRKKLQQCVTFCLILMNYFSVIDYFQLNDSYTLYQGYGKGYNIMALHIILLLGTDFKHQIHQVILNSTIRIVFSFLYDHQWQIPQYFLIISLIFAQITLFYFLNLAFRKQFLLTIKEQQIQLFIPIVIQRPFYYFEYQNYQFQLIKTNTHFQSNNNHTDLLLDYCEGCRFRQILRTYRINGETLEHFILNRINLNANIQYSQQQLEISTNYKQKQIIQYSELFSDKTQFLIVFSQHVTDLYSYLEIKDYYNKFQSFIFNHIRSTYRILKLPKSDILKNLLRLNLSCTSGLLFEDNTVKEFNAAKIIKVLRKIGNRYVQINQDADLVINTYKSLFIIAFYQIFELFNQLEANSNTRIYLSLVTNQQKGQTYLQIIISIKQLDKFIQMWKENKVLNKIENLLFAEIIYCETFKLMILDLGYSVPYQQAYQQKKLLSYEDEHDGFQLL